MSLYGDPVPLRAYPRTSLGCSQSISEFINGLPFAVAVVKSGVTVSHDVQGGFHLFAVSFLEKNGTVRYCITGFCRYSADVIKLRGLGNTMHSKIYKPQQR